MKKPKSTSNSIHPLKQIVPSQPRRRTIKTGPPPPLPKDDTKSVEKGSVDVEGLYESIFKPAPTAQELKDTEKTRYFGVPVKVYNNPNVVLSSALNEEEKAELEKYGSRIIMSKGGHVVGLEVRQDLLPKTGKESLNFDCCQCGDRDYEVSEGLRANKKIRRTFMAKVLLIETILRIPGMILLDYQRTWLAFHEFLSHQIPLQAFLCLIAQATRAVSLRGSTIGKYEPCKSVVTLITTVSHTIVASLWTTCIGEFLDRTQDAQQLEDPPSLAAINRKLKPALFIHPYMLPYMSGFNMCMNAIFIILLFFQSKFLDELGNMFVTIYLGVGFVVGTLSYSLGVYGILEDARAFDAIQFLFGILFATNWGMWRFYHLQLVVRGKILRVTENDYQLVAINFAI